MTITPPRSLITCAECGAQWEGFEGDGCYWCDKRYRLRRQSERQRLLFPEWMNWGERFYRCSDIDRIVWAQTRGFTGDYVGRWEDALCNAIESGDITDADGDAAYVRRDRWMTHMRNSANA